MDAASPLLLLLRSGSQALEFGAQALNFSNCHSVRSFRVALLLLGKLARVRFVSLSLLRKLARVFRKRARVFRKRSRMSFVGNLLRKEQRLLAWSP